MEDILRNELNKDYTQDKILILSFLYLINVITKKQEDELDKYFYYSFNRLTNSINEAKNNICKYYNYKSTNNDLLNKINPDLFKNTILMEELIYKNYIKRNTNNNIYITHLGVEYLKTHYNNNTDLIKS